MHYDIDLLIQSHWELLESTYYMYLCRKKADDHYSQNGKRMHEKYSVGNSDCGLYAIAYATRILHGYIYNQNLMHTHSLQCFELRKLTPFPG